MALLCLTGWMALFCNDGIWQEYITVLPSEYGNWSGHIDYEEEEFNSGLYIFPENVSNALDVDYLYYTAIDFHSIGNNIIYAEVTYSEEDYIKEIERIANIECKIKMSPEGDYHTNNINYSEDLFAYPAYVAIYACNLRYEYVLMDEANHKIIYIYSHLKDMNGVIPQEYLPLEVIGKDMYENSSWDNINIYYSEDENGDHMSYDGSAVLRL